MSKPIMDDEDAYKKEIALLRSCIKEDTEEIESAKKMAREVLSELEVYGDNYGVPTLVDIVETLVFRVQQLEKYEPVRQ